MADGYSLGQAGTLSADEFAQQQQLNRQQQMAALLMQQGQRPAQGQMISGRYVAPSFFQNITPLVQTAIGSYLGNKADTEAAKLANAIRQNKGDVEQQIINKMTAQPETKQELAGPYTGNVPMPVAVQPGREADYAGALKMIQMNPYGVGKEYVPTILKQLTPEPTNLEKEWKAAKAQGYTGTINDFKNQMSEADKARIAIDKQRLGLEGARFGLEKEKFANELGGTKLTETQGNATGFGLRAKEANQIATQLEQKGVAIPGKTSTVVSGIAGMTPFVGDKYSEATKSLFNVLPEAMGGLSSDQQLNSQARKNFVSAVLRKESGAAISPQEYATEEKKYFAQLGDSDAVIKQKQDARNMAIRALELQAGPGAKFIKEAGAPNKVVNFNDLP
jgi:hypothetical protein